MQKSHLKTSRVGRPQKSILARRQTCLWAESVRVRTGAGSFRDLEAVLGDEGKWEGMWSRYERGLVVPSGKRMGRIEMMVPGTARYFYAGFWQLLENRSYSWEDLDQAIDSLPPWLFPELRRTAKFGRLNATGKEKYLMAATEMVADAANGIHGLAVILILIREAELAQDERQYLTALKAWAEASEKKRWHPILYSLSYSTFQAVVKPLWGITFADSKINAAWQQFFCVYIECRHHGKRPDVDEFDWMHCVARFFFFTPQPREVLERLIKYDTSELALYAKYLSWN